MLTSHLFFFTGLLDGGPRSADPASQNHCIYMEIVLGPFVLNLLDSLILSISADPWKMAFDYYSFKGEVFPESVRLKSRTSAVMMAFVPAALKILAFVLFARASSSKSDGGG